MEGELRLLLRRSFGSRHFGREEQALTSTSRQARALTELAFQMRHRADADVGKLRTEREREVDAEREKTSRLKSLRLARDTAVQEREIACEGARPAVINRWRTAGAVT
jgi:hypothetical protein